MTRKQLMKLVEKAHLQTVYSASFVGIRRRSVSILLWNDGSITRGDVDLSLARNMTVKEAATALQLIDASTQSIAAAINH